MDIFDTPDEVVSDGEVLRDRWGRYLLPALPKLTAKGALAAPAKVNKPWTRATTFAKAIADTFALNAWSQRMAIKGIAMREDLYALTAATPLEDRDKLNEIVEEAKKAAGARKAASLGTAVHAFTEAIDRGESPTIPKPWQRDVTAYRALLAQHGLSIPAKAIERIVINEKFGVAGTLDRIAKLTQDLTFEQPGGDVVTLPSGAWFILDLKTGRDLSYGWNEIAIQLYLYASADAMWNPDTWRYEKMPAVSQEWALVVHLPVGEATATLEAINLTVAAKATPLAYEVRNWRKTRAMVYVIGTAEAPPAADTTEPVLEAVDPAAGVVPDPVAPGLNEALAVAKSRAKADARKLAAEVLGTPITDDDILEAHNNQRRNLNGPPMEADNVADHERVEMAPTVTVKPATWEDKVKAATTKQELSALWKAGTAAGEWSDTLTALGKEQMSKMDPGQK